MNIRRAVPEDHGQLLDIWLRSVRATHTSLSEEDIRSFLPIVSEVALVELEVWVLGSDTGALMGFMGLSGSELEALFLDPQFQRCGGGRRLVQHARELYGELTLDVNEQNPGAFRFYLACGFVLEGRSALDSTGRPFPLLHLRLPSSHGMEPQSEAVAQELAKLQGTWKQIAHVSGGVPDPPEERGWEPRATIIGERFVVTLANGTIALAGTFRLDPTQEPKSIDWTDTYGPDAGKTFPAIYTLEDDRLTFCAADAGQPRPSELRSGPGQELRISQREPSASK